MTFAASRRIVFRAGVRLAFVSILMATVCNPAVAAASRTRAGAYDNVHLAIDGDRLTGTFADARGGYDGFPSFNCAFVFSGTIDGDEAEIETLTPGDDTPIPGHLRFTQDGLELKLKDNQAGCLSTSGDMAHQPFKASRDGDGTDWKEVAMVSARRATFYATPGVKAPRAPFVVEFDTVVVRERKPGWVRATYVDGQKPVTGWLRAGDLTIMGGR